MDSLGKLIVTHNKELNGIELKFENYKLSPDDLKFIRKGSFFRWHRGRKIFYGRKSTGAIRIVNALKQRFNESDNLEYQEI